MTERSGSGMLIVEGIVKMRPPTECWQGPHFGHTNGPAGSAGFVGEVAAEAVKATTAGVALQHMMGLLPVEAVSQMQTINQSTDRSSSSSAEGPGQASLSWAC
mmetsp:Transcript_37913/g.68568  ORF Transcript_37913/g.68568 Transcript_37913/m.68568 type:complete len:103 (-) Transcript_37913:2-310(-)